MSARSRDDRGMVTAELAACLPALLLVLAVALSAVSVVAARVRVQDAAREAARAAARGDTSAARRLAAYAAPGGSVRIGTDGDEVSAVVSLRVHPLSRWLPAVTVTERAVAALEPTSADTTALRFAPGAEGHAQLVLLRLRRRMTALRCAPGAEGHAQLVLLRLRRRMTALRCAPGAEGHAQLVLLRLRRRMTLPAP